MSLRVDARARVGELDLDVEVEAPSGSVTAVLGPNGAGKSTLLRCIAGSVAIDEGAISLDGRVLDAPPDTYLPPPERRLGIVHQDCLLFPHLSALDNVAFGPRARGLARREARARAAELLDRVGLGSHASLGSRALSGGQAQRVALARALAVDPSALLLDEPLAALDATARVEVRRDLRGYLKDFEGPTLLVTHDPLDALVLADRVAVLERGHITQSGTLAEVTTRPRSRYIADLIGTNLIHGSARGLVVTTEAGVSFATAEPHEGAVLATVAPTAVSLHRREPEGSPRNRWPSTVAYLDRLGDRVRVHLAPPLDLVAEVTPAAVSELAITEGDAVWVSVKATEITAFGR